MNRSKLNPKKTLEDPRLCQEIKNEIEAREIVYLLHQENLITWPEEKQITNGRYRLIRNEDLLELIIRKDNPTLNHSFFKHIKAKYGQLYSRLEGNVNIRILKQENIISKQNAERWKREATSLDLKVQDLQSEVDTHRQHDQEMKEIISVTLNEKNDMIDKIMLLEEDLQEIKREYEKVKEEKEIIFEKAKHEAENKYEEAVIQLEEDLVNLKDIMERHEEMSGVNKKELPLDYKTMMNSVLRFIREIGDFHLQLQNNSKNVYKDDKIKEISKETQDNDFHLQLKNNDRKVYNDDRNNENMKERQDKECSPGQRFLKSSAISFQTESSSFIRNAKSARINTPKSNIQLQMNQVYRSIEAAEVKEVEIENHSDKSNTSITISDGTNRYPKQNTRKKNEKHISTELNVPTLLNRPKLYNNDCDSKQSARHIHDSQHEPNINPQVTPHVEESSHVNRTSHKSLPPLRISNKFTLNQSRNTMWDNKPPSRRYAENEKSNLGGYNDVSAITSRSMQFTKSKYNFHDY